MSVAEDWFITRKAYSTDWYGLQSAMDDYFRQKYGSMIDSVGVDRSEYEVVIYIGLDQRYEVKNLPEEFQNHILCSEQAGEDGTLDNFDIEYRDTYSFVSEALGEDIIKILTTDEMVYCITKAHIEEG